MAFELGTRVGDYQLIDVVESNREGTSYKVRNVPQQCFEVLRVLSEATQSDRLRVERFQREAKILARLNHTHIVNYRASSLIDGRLVIATELVEGTSLAERLEVGPISLLDSVRYIWQALEALECAHAEGVVHRDVTPAKLLISSDSELKLSGFSLARSTADPRLTQVGVAIGSAHYMSPEQVQANSELDARSDLYSLGVVFYELVAGRKLFDSESQFDVMLAHIETAPDPPSKWNPQVSAELDELILKALAKRAESRFQTAREFRDALMTIPLGASPEPIEDIEKALEAMKKKGKQTTRQAQVMTEEILGHEAEMAVVADGRAVASEPELFYGLPKEVAYGLVIIAAVGIFLLMIGLK